MGLIAWRNIICHKGRSAFLGLCVVIGVAFVAGTFVLTDTIKNTFTQVFDQAYQGVAVSVRTQSDLGTTAARSPLPESLVATVRAVSGVRLAEGGVFTTGGRIFDASGKALGNPFAPAFLASWPANAELSSFHIVSGTPPNGAGQVVIDQQAADQGKFAVGATIRVQTMTGLHSFRLVGITKYGTAGNLGGASAALFDLATAQRETGRMGQLDDISVAGAKGITDGALQDRIQAAVGPKYEAITGTQLSSESTDAVNKGLGFLSTFLLAFAAVSMFVGAFIVYNTFAIVVAQRTREMALLRALGADSEQVIGSILVESVLIGLLSSLVGLGGGVVLAIGLKQLLAAVGLTIPAGSVVVLPRTIIVSILGGIAMTVISAVAPAIHASRVPPLAAVRTLTNTSTTKRRGREVVGLAVTVSGVACVVTGARTTNTVLLGIGSLDTVLGVALLAPTFVAPFVHVLAAPLRRFRGVSGQLAEENAARSAQRTSTTAAALMIGTALIAASLVLAASINTSTDKIISQGLKADLIITSDGLTGIGPDLTAALRTTPGVRTVAAYRYGAFELGDSTKQLSAMDGSALDPNNADRSLDLDVSSGTMARLDSGIAVSDRVAKDHRWKVGDRLDLVFASGKRQLPIVAIFTTTAFGDYMISLATHQAVYADSTDQLAFVRVQTNTDLTAVKARVKTLLTKTAPSAKVQDQEEYGAQIRAQVSQILSLITALVLLAIVIALMGVLITMLLSVLERTHELGLLRAVGMDRRDVRSMVRWEAAIISTFGAVLGVVLGIGLGGALTRTLRDQGITTFQLPYRSLVLMVLLVTLAGVGASLYPARRAGRLNVLQAIASD